MDTQIDMPIHPAANVFPLMSGSEYTRLLEDIQAHGLQVPITLCDGQILDGRNRYRACRDAGVAPQFSDYTGDSPIAFAWSVNVPRRNLTPSQIAMASLDILTLLEADAETRRALNLRPESPDALNSTHREQGRSAEKVAKITGTGVTIIAEAKFVKKTDPDLAARVTEGTISVHGAFKRLKAAPAAKSKPPRMSKAERIDLIRALANEGNTSQQIAIHAGCQATHVRLLAKKAGIILPDSALGKRPNINPQRVISETVNGIAGYMIGLESIDGLAVEYSHEEARELAKTLAGAIRTLTKLRKQLETL